MAAQSARPSAGSEAHARVAQGRTAFSSADIVVEDADSNAADEDGDPNQSFAEDGIMMSKVSRECTDTGMHVFVDVKTERDYV